MSEAPKVRGGPGPSALLMKACELLDDFTWHDYERVLREVGKVVPPGQAIRRNEQERVSGGGPTQRHQPQSPEALIRSGKRSKARETLWGKDYFEHREVQGVRQVRMVYLPPRVLRERSRVRAHRLFVPTRLADEIGVGLVDPPALLGELTYPQLLDVAIELANRERERVRMRTRPSIGKESV